MGNRVESLGDVEQHSVDLLSVIKSFGQIVDSEKRLRLTKMVTFWSHAVSLWGCCFLKMSNDAAVYNTLQDVAGNGCKWNGSVICRWGTVDSLEDRGDQCWPPIWWNLPTIKKYLDRWVRPGANSSVASYNSLPGTLSGPDALWGFVSTQNVTTTQNVINTQNLTTTQNVINL